MNRNYCVPSFKGDYSWLSNMHQASFVDREGRQWSSSEHYYQAHKFEVGSTQFLEIWNCKSPYEAKKLGRGKAYPTDADKVRIMKWALWFKFTQNEYLKERLLSTGTETIEEANTWNDTFWGVCNGKGKNVLGILLMQLRAKLREPQ